MIKSLSIILIVSLFLSMCLMKVPQSAYAESPVKSIFVDTIFGLATGALIGAAVTLADSNAKGDDWGKNIGIGATIGAFVGAGFGLATETQSLAYFDGKELSFRFPIPRPCKLSGSESSSMVSFNLLDWRY